MWSRFGGSVFLRRFAVACVAVTVVSAGALVVGDRAGKHEFAKRSIVRLPRGVLSPALPAKPANFLLIGHDATGNSDTMMVVHVDPAVSTPLLVSFPRDLIVEIPGHGRGQLNAAFGLGGPALLILTLKADFGIPIQYFLQVDFNTFPQIISAIGHVRVWFPTPVHDPYIGLNVNQPGCVSLDGPMALAYVRSRHYYVPDNLTNPAPWLWNYDPKLPENAYRGGQGWTASGSDIDRIPRQQYFLRTVAQAVISRTRDDPLRIFGVVNAVMSHLKTDQYLTFDELKALIRTFRRIKPADVDMETLPWMPDPANTSRVVVKQPDAQLVADRLANFTPPPPVFPTLVNPHTITVRVLNGSPVPGLAAQVLTTLTAAGFRAAGPAANADRSTYARTEVRYPPAKNSQAATVLYATGATTIHPTTTSTQVGDVLVIVGADWNTLQHHLTNLPGTQPATTTHTAGTTQAPTTTTVAADPRYLPINPKTHGILVGCP
jgi:LCP family protein required for cell wall assembly